MASAINAPQETLPGIDAGPASCDVLSVGPALQVEVGLLSATLLCAGSLRVFGRRVFTCSRRKLVDSVSFLSRCRCLSGFSGVCVFALPKHASIPGSSALERPGAMPVRRHQHAVC